MGGLIAPYVNPKMLSWLAGVGFIVIGYGQWYEPNGARAWSDYFHA
jgi:hypothetical protein